MASPQAVQKLTIFTKDLNPWTPAIDQRRVEKPQIVTGTNFYDDIDGPRSAFSTELVNFNYWDAATRGKITDLALVDRGKLIGTQTGVWLINSDTGLAEPILIVNITDRFWPWTVAFVGGLMYLAQYNIGLWQYDPGNNSLAHITTPVGDNISYVNENNGRLIYLTPDSVAWSDLDDGTALTPSLTTGAGAQELSLVGGKGLAIVSLADGFLVYTTIGIMKGSFVQAAYVFKFDVWSGAIKIWSPNAALYVPDLGAVCLDGNGFHLIKEYNYSDFGKPQQWEPEKSEYIQSNILRMMDRNLYGTIAMFYSLVEQALFVSFSSNTNEGLMITTFVYKQVNKRWSSFDHQQTGIFETYNPVFNISNCSYMAPDGYMRAFSNTDFSQDLPPDPYIVRDYAFRPIVEERLIQATIDTPGNPVVQMGYTEINTSDNNPEAYANFTIPGLFEINQDPYSDVNNDSQDDPPMDVSGSPIIGGTYINSDVNGGIEYYALGYEPPHIGLNSVIEIGPLRFTDQIAPDETSLIDAIVLGLAQTSNFTVTEDWNLLTGNEDWNVLDGAEDWGAGNATPNIFQLELLTTNDGVNPIPPYTLPESLPVFNNLGSSLTYSPMGTSGIYHYLNLKALNPGESFALKVADVGGLLTGRLMNG